MILTNAGVKGKTAGQVFALISARNLSTVPAVLLDIGNLPLVKFSIGTQLNASGAQGAQRNAASLLRFSRQCSHDNLR